MDPKGFEPSTPTLRAWCSNQTELRIHALIKKEEFKNMLETLFDYLKVYS